MTEEDRRVILLGSGFSRQLSIEFGLDSEYPTIGSFWKFAKSEHDRLKNSVHGWDNFWYLYEAFQEEMGFVPDVEQLLDMVELAIQSNEILTVGEHVFEPAVIRNQLLFTITLALTEPQGSGPFITGPFPFFKRLYFLGGSL